MAKNENPILEYNELVQSEKLIANDKIKKIYKYLAELIENKESPDYYNEEKVNFAINFIETFCKHSKGKWGGKPVVLELWQKAFIAAIFGILVKATNKRRFREVFLLVARKNGKSVISSAIALLCLVGDYEAGAECYSVATKKEQARIIWDEADKMVAKSPDLSQVLKRYKSEIQFPYAESSFKPLSSESRTLDGLNVHFAGIDELHAITDMNLYSVIQNGTSAREQPLILITTTAGTQREGIFDLKYKQGEDVIKEIDSSGDYSNRTFLPIMYELDSRSEWQNNKTWIKANPNLGVSKTVEYLTEQVNLAKKTPEMVANLLCKDFNLRENSTESWLTFEEVNNESTYDLSVLKPVYAIGGTDLSRTTDLTSACLLFRVKNDPIIYLKHMYWLPADLFEQRVKEDKIKYDVWYKQGLLRLCEGNQINPNDVTEWYKEICRENGFYLSYCGYDRYSAEMWVRSMKEEFGEDVPIPVAQGVKTLSNPMMLLGADLRAKKINYNNNPLTKWCFHNTSTKTDVNGNIQPAKGLNQRRRIDGLAAALNAYVIYNNKFDDYMSLIG